MTDKKLQSEIEKIIENFKKVKTEKGLFFRKSLYVNYSEIDDEEYGVSDEG